MDRFFAQLGDEAQSLGKDLNSLPWWVHALLAVLAFVLFLAVFIGAVIL